jgi:GNAT superfamily N-acetyltransferase
LPGVFVRVTLRARAPSIKREILLKVQDNKFQFVTLDDPVREAKMAAAVSNADDPLMPVHHSQIRRRDEHWNKKYFKQRSFVFEDGEPVCCLIAMEPYWFDSDDLIQGRVRLVPELENHGLLEAGIKRLEQTGKDRGKNRVNTMALGLHGGRIEELKQLGYREKMRFPITSLSMSRFAPEPFEAKVEAVRGTGIRLMTFREYSRENPEAVRAQYIFDCEVMKDVPSPEPFTPEPFEKWAEYMADEDLFQPDWLLLAVEDGQIVGCSGLNRNKVDPTVFETQLTGCLRSHRRRGLATALKVEVLRRARDAGAREVYTDNEENNPMLQLNYALGFKEKTFAAEFTKTLD